MIVVVLLGIPKVFINYSCCRLSHPRSLIILGVIVFRVVPNQACRPWLFGERVAPKIGI